MHAHNSVPILGLRCVSARGPNAPYPAEFFKECQNLLLEQHDFYCLVAIDEYEEIDAHIDPNAGYQHPQTLTRELLLELRNTLQHRTRFMFLFAGAHYLRELSAVNWSEIFINLKTLHISFLTPEDGRKLLTKPVRGLTYQHDELITKILNLTGCQPFLLQAMASELVHILNSDGRQTVTDNVLARAIDEVIDKYGTYFDYIWDTECPGEKHRELLKIVMGKDSGIADSDLTNYRMETKELIHKEVLKNHEGRIALTMPMLAYWIKKNQYAIINLSQP